MSKKPNPFLGQIKSNRRKNFSSSLTMREVVMVIFFLPSLRRLLTVKRWRSLRFESRPNIGL